MPDLYIDPKTFDKTCCIYLTSHTDMITLAQFREQRQQARLEQVIATDAIYITCKFCGSKDVVKNGLR